jgi:hypothetical protein
MKTTTARLARCGIRPRCRAVRARVRRQGDHRRDAAERRRSGGAARAKLLGLPFTGRACAVRRARRGRSADRLDSATPFRLVHAPRGATRAAFSCMRITTEAFSFRIRAGPQRPA